MSGSVVVGVISDTHSLVRPEALAALAGSELILHAGDVGAPEVLAALRAIAPVTPVRGNNDRGAWASALRETERVEVGGLSIYMLHDANQLDLDPRAARIAAVVAGHSHQPRNEMRDGLLFFNPGSAGPRRFRLPISVGKLHVHHGSIRGEILRLDGDG
jgi:putative phosphoesterase